MSTMMKHLTAMLVCLGLILSGAAQSATYFYHNDHLGTPLTDILEEGMHAGFRLGDRLTQNMVAVRLTAPMALSVVGSPAYLDRRSTPKSPGDLLQHNCIRYRFQTSGQIAPWTFVSDNGDYGVEVGGQLIVNTLPASIEMARQGLGLVYTFKDLCAADLDEGRLVSVLDEHLRRTPGLYIYFPREYRNMVPLRLIIGYLREGLEG